MFKVKQLVWVTGCVSVLGGCALYPSSSKQALNIKPVMEVKHAGDNPNAMYSLGRYYQGKVNYTEAIAAYEKALAADPAHVEAHNGLGVSYSLQGRHELALQHLRKAIELTPMAAHLHNNLGYVHLVQGQESEAAAAFEQALRLDPENRQARKSLVTVYERVGLHDKAAMLALAIPAPAATSAVALGTPSAAMPASGTAATVEKQVMQQAADTRLVQVAPDVFEFRMTEAASMMAILTGKTSGNAAASQDSGNLYSKNVRMEISNGNGVRGMARLVSGFLQQGGFAKAGLTNQQPFQQKQTEIHYRSGNDVLAGQINRLMPKQVAMVESSSLRQDIQVRVLLGKDVVREVAYFNNRGKMQKIAQNTGMATAGEQARK
jgi:tetratricopeptide (TPR) repeat protein